LNVEAFYVTDESKKMTISVAGTSQAETSEFRCPNSSDCYILSDEACIEDFDDGSLVLLCERLHLVQLNPVARTVLDHLDGQRTVREAAEELAEIYDQPLESVLSDILELLADLECQGVVKRRTCGV